MKKGRKKLTVYVMYVSALGLSLAGTYFLVALKTQCPINGCSEEKIGIVGKGIFIELLMGVLLVSGLISSLLTIYRERHSRSWNYYGGLAMLLIIAASFRVFI